MILSNQAKIYVELIRERIKYLQDSVIERETDGRGIGFQKKEIAALEWAMTLIVDDIDTTVLESLYRKYRVEEEIRERTRKPRLEDKSATVGIQVVKGD